LIRNHVASLLLGLSPVRKLAADIASEISIGYTHSPLNAGHAIGHDTPAPGDRAPIRTSESVIGSGSIPRFVIFASPDGMPPDLLQRYANILEPTLREPFHASGLWLVCPDGYTALAAKSGDWTAVTEYLDNITGIRTPDLMSTSLPA
jgi:hypothetical protein